MQPDSVKATPRFEPNALMPQSFSSGRIGTASNLPEVILSFDIEEHFRIEAAAGLVIPPALRADHNERVVSTTRWLLDQLGERGVKATFFVLGQIAAVAPTLIREIHQAGHEVASHGWDHRRVLALDPQSFREDVRRSKDALEQASGTMVVGYRAPTFSIIQRTAWALDILAELGFLYDSSIYPVRHDRYGVAHAPRWPFLAQGVERSILEIPPATLRLLGTNIPSGGGGYFRLFPPSLIRRSIVQAHKGIPAVAMLYFHPWEFDPEQPRLPLRGINRFRTYVGITRSQKRLRALMAGSHHFVRADEVAFRLVDSGQNLTTFRLADR